MHDIRSLITDLQSDLAGLDDFSLRGRLLDLLSPYGQVRRLELVRADLGQARRVMCFLRMASGPQEQAVVAALGMGRFGGDLVLVLDCASAVAPGHFTRPQRGPAAVHTALAYTGNAL